MTSRPRRSIASSLGRCAFRSPVPPQGGRWDGVNGSSRPIAFRAGRMSIFVISEVWEHSKADGSRLLVLLALADRAPKDDACCWPGIRTVARQARLSEREVQRHVASLIKMGELRRIERGGRNGRLTSIYQVTVGRYRGVSVVTPRDDRLPTPGGDNRGDRGVSLVTPNPLVDPLEPKEPSGGESPTEIDPSTHRLRLARGATA